MSVPIGEEPDSSILADVLSPVGEDTGKPVVKSTANLNGADIAIPAGEDTRSSIGERTVILAAGALPWRRSEGRLQVAMVHRPRYDDWAWAKGKLDAGEDWSVAAVREVFEETGFQVRLGRPLPPSEYRVMDRSGQPATKQVRYWAAEVVSGDGSLVNEIDEVAWLDVDEAMARLSYARDHEQLRALVRADRAATLATWPLAVVRHAKSRQRSKWRHQDQLRPLDARGVARAEDLVPILAAFRVTRVVTSPSVRCMDTVLPYAAAGALEVRAKPGLSEEGFAEDPERAPYHVRRVLEHAEAAVVCSHRPVLPSLLKALAAIADPDESAASVVLLEAAHHGMGKGEALVAHVVGTGDDARIVDLERYAVK